jgi:hypothetical protein
MVWAMRDAEEQAGADRAAEGDQLDVPALEAASDIGRVKMTICELLASLERLMKFSLMSMK